MFELYQYLSDDLKVKLKKMYSTYKLKTEIRTDDEGKTVKLYSIRNLANHVLCYGVDDKYTYDPNDLQSDIIIEPDSEYLNIFYKTQTYESKIFFVLQIIPYGTPGTHDTRDTYNPELSDFDKWVIIGSKIEYGSMFLNENELTNILKELGIDDVVISKTFEKYKRGKRIKY